MCWPPTPRSVPGFGHRRGSFRHWFNQLGEGYGMTEPAKEPLAPISGLNRVTPRPASSLPIAPNAIGYFAQVGWRRSCCRPSGSSSARWRRSPEAATSSRSPMTERRSGTGRRTGHSRRNRAEVSEYGIGSLQTVTSAMSTAPFVRAVLAEEKRFLHETGSSRRFAPRASGGRRTGPGLSARYEPKL
jgi:hypothetical protein